MVFLSGYLNIEESRKKKILGGFIQQNQLMIGAVAGNRRGRAQ